MALIDKASLLMVPSTYEAGKLYNVLPSGNRAPDNKGGAGYDQTRADFDFDRGSNAAATRINSSGLIEKYRENLLLQSNNFGTTWTTSAASVTSGQSGYDSSSNAWLLNASSSATESYVRQTTSASGVDSFSIYAKAGTADQLALYIATSGADVYSWFDLTNGTTGSGANQIDKKITSVGSGWYRITLTGLNYDQRVDVYVANANGSFLSNSGDNILIQSAQLETGLVATDYLNSTSVTAKAGVLIDLPRINYDANGENGSLLLEPSRQNLVTHSEYISGWTPSGLTTSENQTTSPEGLQNAAKLTLSSVTEVKRIALGSMPTTAVARSFSFFVKSDDITAIQLVHSGDLQGYAKFDISSGVVGSKGTKTTSDIEDYGNGWYRCIANFDATNTIGSTIYLYINDSATGTYGGSTSAEGDLFCWGGQYEAGSYPTSYIPNHGESGGVTRAADSCSVTGVSDVIGQTEGTIFLELKGNESTPSESLFNAISDGTSSNRLLIGPTTFANTLRVVVIFNGVSNGGNNYSVTDITDYNKIAVKYTSSSVDVFINGVKQTSQSSGTFSATLDDSTFDNGTAGNKFEGSIKQRVHFNEALSDAECISLTS